MDPSRITIDLKPQEQNLYDRLRAKLAGQRESGSVISDVLLLLPDLTVLLVRLLRETRVPTGAKALALLGLGYVLSPIDLIPELVFGPIGFVDDLLVVAAALSRLLNYVHPDLVRSHWPGRGDALDAIRNASEWAEAQVRRGLRRLLPHWGRASRPRKP